MPNRWFFKISICLLCLLAFLFREYWLWEKFSPQIIWSKDLPTLSVHPQQTWGPSDISEKLKNLLTLSRPYFITKHNHNLLENIDIGERLIMPSLELSRISPNFYIIESQQHRVFWIQPDFEFKEIAAAPITFKSDVWIINTTSNLEQLPLPNKLIISTSQGTVISASLKTRIKEARLPFIQTKKVSPAILNFTEKNLTLKTF